LVILSSAIVNTVNNNSPDPLIYIVDDEVVLGEMAEALLKTEGWNTRVFSSAEAALESFRSATVPPELLVTDCVMHNMNGIELIRSCRDTSPKLKAILLSGTVAEDYIHAQKTQPDRFIHKPYRADTLLRAVRELIGRNNEGFDARP
jgi:two-component system phosphate regulon response regulator PhoB